MKDIVKLANGVVDKTRPLTAHSDADWAVLRAVKDVTGPWALELAAIYEDAIHANPETAKVAQHVNRADHQQAFAVWFEMLATGAPGSTFWAETYLIGLAHASTSVHNEYVIGMARMIEDAFLRRCLAAFPGERAIEVYSAFKRAFSVALAVMVESYLHALMTGMEQIGMNERLANRIRTVAIRKMIDEARGVLPLIDWNETLSVGLEGVDTQHRRLVDILNSLHDSSAQGQGSEVLKNILRELVGYTVEHFAYEERLMKEHHYPAYDQHRQAHVALTTQVAAFNEQFQAGKARLSGDLFRFLRSWLNGHIRGTDKLYSAHLRAAGVK